MKKPRIEAVVSAFVAAVSILGAATESSAWTGLEGPPYPFWGLTPVKYYMNKASFPPGIAATAEQRLVAGFASWAAPDCTDFETQLMGDLPGGTYDSNDSKNVLLWINKPDTWPGELGPVDSVIGVTMPVWSGDGMGNSLIYDADIVFNNVGFCWFDYNPANPGATCSGGTPVDTQSIATHEQGHFLGLGHTNSPGATMEPAYSGGNDIASIEEDDINGVCTLYPLGASATSCTPCRLGAANNECSTQTKACTGQCIGLYTCISACPTSDQNAYDTCATQCSDQYKDGVMAYTAYANCVCNICAEQCPTQCGGSSGGNGGAGGSSSSGGWSDGGDGGGPSLTDDDGCGCAVIGSEKPIGAIAALGFVVMALSRRRRSG